MWQSKRGTKRHWFVLSMSERCLPKLWNQRTSSHSATNLSVAVWERPRWSGTPLLSTAGAAGCTDKSLETSDVLWQQDHSMENMPWNFSETSYIPSIAQNKPSWAVTCAVKRSVCSSVVERLMITTENNLLTHNRPESAATGFHTQH